MSQHVRFAGYPSAVAYAEPDGKDPVQHLLWGFFVDDKGEKRGSYSVKDIYGNTVKGKYVRAHIRGEKEDVWIREHEIQDERLLEVIFVDIGQGDGCLVVTPEDKHIIIDAGEEDNMYRFLRWRYGGFKKKFKFAAGVISHPDSDHYHGFKQLFDDPNVFFDTLYHNGIMERFGKDTLGKKVKIDGISYLKELITTKEALEEFLKTRNNWEKTVKDRVYQKQFPTMLKNATDNKKFDRYEMLSSRNGHLPGYGTDKALSIQVLGPVIEHDDVASPVLRWIKDNGKTKNGHSVVLRLNYRNVSLLLGGDLNIPAEHLLLSHHTGIVSPPKNSEDEEALVEAARKIFQVDIAKSCHHGSSDFTHLFLRAVNPIATVISSGDDEPHSHPRADTLGSIGLYSRGTRPLIFSTELARSTKETIKHPHILRHQLEQQLKEINEVPAKTATEQQFQKKKEEEFLKEMERVIDRSVAVFGAISLVSDGYKVIIAQKLERSRGNDDKWDIYRLEAEGSGPLRYQSKH